MKKKAKQDIVSRYEAKYIIPRGMVPQIRAFIGSFCKPDPNTRGFPPEYTITTLQLDTDAYSLHYAKEVEANARFKLRVRTYGEIGSAPVFAEVKAKFEGTIVKTRATVPFNAWNEGLIFGTKVPNCFKNERQEMDFLQFKRVVWEMGAKPVALVRYIRESYIGTVDAYVRITFDRHLEYQATRSWDDFGRSGIWRGMDSQLAQGFGLPYSGVVMEVKTLSYYPVWVVDMLQRFNLRRNGNCKYSTAIWREGAFTRYPETNAATDESLCWM
ncbi:MAG: polyphosphate polymerase domain-containing protein [Kiritimatiellae bacterium]|nr:polyphosphate polymerase domain-containing protein [Kiritimatiellia bacterium]